VFNYYTLYYRQYEKLENIVNSFCFSEPRASDGDVEHFQKQRFQRVEQEQRGQRRAKIPSECDTTLVARRHREEVDHV